MNHTYLTNEQKELWLKVANNIAKAKALIDDAELIVKLELECKDPHVTNAIANMEEALRGQAYMFTPQSEWTGGESYKMRSPHIANL